MAAIEVDHLSKEFRLGALRTLKESLANSAARLLGKEVQQREQFKALDDVSFSVDQGEVVGIIGHNGAGKSTLLKMIAGISTPTSGKVSVSGRISPLIEVGAGFVPEFTGRENVYLNASILGMRRREIAKKYDEIVEFAELSGFMDTPVKRYSSGMQVKLAFAVATSVESEILIVDEVLAVGDLAFQQKCIERMEKLIKHQGRTVLIVGHNIRQIQRICNRVILLDHGRITEDGNPAEVCGTFYQEAQARNIARHEVVDGEIVAEQSDQSIKVTAVEILDEHRQPVKNIGMHEPMSIRVHFETKRAIPGLEVVAALHTSDFVQVLAVGNAATQHTPSLEPGIHQLECRLDDLPLKPGAYALRLLFADSFTKPLWSAENILSILVTQGAYDIARLPRGGLIHIPSTWRFDDELASAGAPIRIGKLAGQASDDGHR